VDFSIERTNRGDTTFFENHIVAGTQTHILKYPYLDISVEGYLQSVFLANGSEEYLHEVTSSNKYF